MEKSKENSQSNTKNKSSKRVFYNIITFILIVIIAFCLFKIGKILWGYYEGTKTYDEVAKIATKGAKDSDKIDFDKLLQKNPDTKAWIKLKGTNINYPIVQGSNNDFYLYRMFNKEYNRKGSIFVDSRIENPFQDFMTIVYGHNMKDNTMFSHIMDYKDQDFYDKHKKMLLYTPSAKYNMYIVGAMYLDASASQYKLYFNDFEKQSYVDWISANSLVKTTETATAADKIVMLSTCTNVDEDGRFVVFGKLVPR